MQLDDSHIGLDLSAFEKLFHQWFEVLCRFASSYVNDQNAAEEIVQDIFVNLWTKRSEIDPGGAVKSYLFTSVKNRCLNHIRDHKKFRSHYLDVELELEIPIAEKDLVSERELEKQIQNAIHTLPEKCREVFLLSREEGLKNREIAERLGVSIKTVETQMSKALRVLREELKDYIMLCLVISLLLGK